MCGIAGIITINKDAAITAIAAMNQAQAHRGPDNEGAMHLFTGSGYLAFGHRRLSIIDLSSAGYQPMKDAERGNWIIFNGEIYNFKELRNELEKLDEKFLSVTDTEVVLKAYGCWGTDFLKRLRGIFALAIWDRPGRKLFLARDPLGVKPLYYYHDKDSFLFASEVRAILDTGKVPRNMDHLGLHSYLAYGSVQEPLTLISGIKSLLPGHALTWKEGKASTQRYWRFPEHQVVQTHAPADILEIMRSVLCDTVRMQLVSDVPLGAFLSGGIDSTSVTALMKKANQGPVRTFSIVFDEAPNDERQWSRLAARSIGTDHTELFLVGKDVAAMLPKALAAYDQPSMDGLNTWFVSKAVRDAGLTVALSGLGGDEAFGGYDAFSKPLRIDRLHRFISLLPAHILSFLSSVLNWSAHNEVTRKMADLLITEHHPYFVSRRLFSPSQIRQLLHPEAQSAGLGWDRIVIGRIDPEVYQYDPVNRIAALEMQTYMLSTLLRDTDQMSMAHALEVRVPLIDSKLVEFLFTLPGSLKIQSGQPKPLLTRPLEDLLPRECVYRPKYGFELPFLVWLKDALETKIRDSFCNKSVSHAFPFSPDGLFGLWRDFQNGRVNWSRLWSVFVLRHWLDQQHVAM